MALAVASPMEELAAIHIRAAEHQAELAKASGLALDVPSLRAGPATVDARTAR